MEETIREDNGREKFHSNCNNEGKVLRNRPNKKCANPL